MSPCSRIQRFGNAIRMLLLGACLSVAATAQVRINAGGAASGIFSADASYSGGTAANTATTINTSAVTNPAPQGVYQTERWGACTYTITGLTSGTAYTARLHFAEIYFTAAGQRQFNVSINGTQVLKNFDICTAAGGANKGIVKEFTATATGGQVVIALTTGAANNPKISGIEILPPPVTSINAGGGASGSFAADTNFQGGTAAVSTDVIATSEVVNPAPQAVYQSERWGACTYTFSGLQAGSLYTARLHFAEIYFTAAGKRQFDVAINGTQVMNDFDIFAAAGGADKAIVKEFPATVSASGQIVLAFSVGAANNPKISGIELKAGFVYSLVVNPPSFTFLQVDGIKNATVTSNTAWTATSDQSWLTVSPASGSGNGSLSLQAANNSGVARTATVTVKGGGITRQIAISQNAGDTLIVNSATISFLGIGGTSSAAITSNTNWTATSNQSWLTLAPSTGMGDGALSVTVSTNPSATLRSALITIRTAYLTRTIEVIQAGMEPALAPVFTPDGGTFAMKQTVTISCATAGSTIRYTNDGSNPTTDSPVYTGPIELLATTTIKAYATADARLDSPVVSTTFTKSGPDWNIPESITAKYMVHCMGRGINLGNTYDVKQNPRDFASVKEVVDAFISAGLTNVRIPIQWGYRVDAAGNVGLDADGNPTNADIQNAKLLVEYVLNEVNPRRLSEGKTPIILMINTHHEDWAMNDLVGTANFENNMKRLETIWRGICTVFRNESDALTFEFFNEPHLAMDKGDGAMNSVIEMNKRIYSVIRNYTTDDGKKPHQFRKLVFGGINYNSSWGLWSTYTSADRLPGEGNDQYIFGTFHYYNAMTSSTNSFNNVVNNFLKVYDVPVHMGEFGTDHRSGVTETDKTYYQNLGNWAVERGFCITAWDDNGWFQLYNRGAKAWTALLDPLLGDLSIP